jgi:hypothetical protein
MAKYPGAYADHDPKDWEYDFGPVEYTGEVASPYINKVMDDIEKKAFPNGKEAFQKENRSAKARKT